MSRRSVILILVLIVVILVNSFWYFSFRNSRTGNRAEVVLNDRTTSEWLRDVEIGGFQWQNNTAYKLLVAAGPRVVPDLINVLRTSESLKDLTLRLPNQIVPLEKKYLRVDESNVLTLKAQATWVLGAIAYHNPNAPEVRQAVPALVGGLQSGSPIVRWLSAQALGAMGTCASNAVPALIKCTTDADVSLRMSAVEAIGRIGVKTPAATAAITTALLDTSSDVATTATRALRQLK